MAPLLGVLFAVFIGMMAIRPYLIYQQRSFQMIQASNTASQFRQIINAATTYVQENCMPNQSTGSISSSCSNIPLSALQAAGLLPQSLTPPNNPEGANPYGQQWGVTVSQTTNSQGASQVQAFLYSYGGSTIPPQIAPEIAAETGQEGGFMPIPSQYAVYNVPANTAVGAYGHWSATAPNGATQGHLVALLNIGAGQNGDNDNDYLYRTAVPGDTNNSLNTMQAPLSMGGNAISDATSVTTQDGAGEETIDSSSATGGGNFNAPASSGAANISADSSSGAANISASSSSGVANMSASSSSGAAKINALTSSGTAKISADSSSGAAGFSASSSSGATSFNASSSSGAASFNASSGSGDAGFVSYASKGSAGFIADGTDASLSLYGSDTNASDDGASILLKNNATTGADSKISLTDAAGANDSLTFISAAQTSGATCTSSQIGTIAPNTDGSGMPVVCVQEQTPAGTTGTSTSSSDDWVSLEGGIFSQTMQQVLWAANTPYQNTSTRPWSVSSDCLWAEIRGTWIDYSIILYTYATLADYNSNNPSSQSHNGVYSAAAGSSPSASIIIPPGYYFSYSVAPPSQPSNLQGVPAGTTCNFSVAY